MDNVGRMAEQIAAEEGCRLSTARRAVMIEALAKAGRTPDHIASALRLKEATIEKYVKRFSIPYYGAA